MVFHPICLLLQAVRPKSIFDHAEYGVYLHKTGNGDNSYGCRGPSDTQNRNSVLNQQKKDRIVLLDIVRGAAVLGILLMNIRMFSEPSAAYFNPMVYGTHEGFNKIWWAFQALFADQKFMAIFSMLFGASTAIICDGLARRGEPVAFTYAKRIFGLFIIGLIHAYLLWSGDILVSYAMGSFIPFLFRNKSWKLIAVAGLGMLLFGTLSSLGAYYSISEALAEIQASLAEEYWAPPQSAIDAEVVAHRGAYAEHFALRVYHSFAFQTEIFLSWGIWRVGGMMLIGLALYRQGFLSGKLESKTYGLIAAIGLGIGFALTSHGLIENENHNWSFPYSFFVGNLWNYWGSLFIALGYVAIFGWLLAATKFRFGFAALSNVGRAALSNYLFQTIACITIFYGFGGGLYGQMERHQTAIVVIAVWAVQIFLSTVWFGTHTKGPVEDIWHRFTYGRWLRSK